MRRQITISLALIGTVLAIGITIPALLFRGAKTEQSPFSPPFLVEPVIATPINQFDPTLTPPPDLSQSGNCTYTYYFWRDRPGNWPAQVQIGKETITRSQAASFMQAPSKDITVDLQRVLYVTLLNIDYGAERGSIDKTFTDASDWLAAYPHGAPLSEFNKSIAVAFTQALEDYNDGLTGPGLCPNQPATPTPVVSELAPLQAPTDTLPAPTATRRLRRPTFTPTKPPTPKPTRTPTPFPPTATPTLLPPTLTPTPVSPTPTSALISLPPLPTILIPFPTLPLSTQAP